jgi:hypothetical protein
MIELNRDDKQYLAVENFEDYELTYCMAYEMAIRNDEVIKTIFSFYNNYVNHDVNNCGDILNTDCFQKSDIDSQRLMEFFINPLQLYLNYHFFKPINEDIQENKDNEWFSEKINYLLFTPFVKPFYRSDIVENVKLVEYKTTKFYTSFVSHLMNDDKKTMTIHHNSITPNYSRPLLPSFDEIKERNLKLNLALPINELVDFVQKLKKDYDRDHSFFGTVKELIGESSQEKAEKMDNSLSSQMKLADMLYIYDCLKLDYSKSDIKTDITVYYRSKGIKTRNLHHSTFTKYQKIMTDYIDNFRYKELVLGTK